MNTKKLIVTARLKIIACCAAGLLALAGAGHAAVNVVSTAVTNSGGASVTSFTIPSFNLGAGNTIVVVICPNYQIVRLS